MLPPSKFKEYAEQWDDFIEFYIGRLNNIKQKRLKRLKIMTQNMETEPFDTDYNASDNRKYF